MSQLPAVSLVKVLVYSISNRSMRTLAHVNFVASLLIKDDHADSLLSIPRTAT